MTNIAQNSVAKAFVAVVAAAMIFSAFVAPAKAQTIEDLQAQIAALMAQIAALQGGTTSSSSCTAIPAPLTVGAQGANVTALQNYLISAGEVIPAGATGYFGGQTKAALASWQSKNGVSPAVGYYGQITATAMAAKCVPTTSTDDNSDDDIDSDNGDNNDNDNDSDTPSKPEKKDLQGEATLDTVEIDNPSDTTVDEGDEDVEIAEITIGFEDGDAELNRLDVQITNSGNYGTLGTDPWDVFDKLSLWVDGEMIAEYDSSDELDWLDDNSGTFRFSNLDMVFEEDQEYDVILAADINDGLELFELGSWDVYLEALRYFDADGVSSDETQFDELGGDSHSTFTIQNSGQDEQLTFRIGANNPDGGTIVVDDNSTTNDVTIFEYELEAEEADIDLDTLIVRVDTPGVDIENVISNIELVINGQTFSDEGFGPIAQLGAKSYKYATTAVGYVVPNTNGQTIPNLGATNGVAAWYAFDIDNDITIPENEKVTVKVVVDFRQQTLNYTNGTQIQARVTTLERNATDAEGREQLRDQDGSFNGSAIDEPHTLVATGLAFDLVDITEKLVTGAGDTPKDTVEFELTVDVTAVEETFYIEDDGAAAFNVTVTENGTTTHLASTTITKTISASGANKQGNRFRIDNGDSERMKFKVTVFPNGANPGGTYRVQFDDVTFFDVPTAGTPKTQMFVPVSDYRSADITVVN